MLTRRVVKHILGLSIAFFMTAAATAAVSVHEGFNVTPEITSVRAVSHYSKTEELRATWVPIKALGLDTAAVVDGFFYDRSILLAARDSVLIYYSAQLAQTSKVERWRASNISHSGA